MSDADTPHGTLQIPVERKQLGEFVRQLVSQQSTVAGKVPGPFLVKRDDVEDIIQRIEQRVESQNGGVLASMKVDILFDDGSSVSLRSFDDFKKFRDIKTRNTLGISVSMKYILHFPGAEQPVNQEVSFRVSEISQSITKKSRVVFFEDGGAPNRFEYEITYGDLTWALDIENILKDWFNSKKIKMGKMRRFFSKRGYIPALLLFFVLSILSAQMVPPIVSYVYDNILGGDLLTVTTASLIYVNVTSNIFLIILMIFVIVFSVVITDGVAKPVKSAVCFTEADEKRHKEILDGTAAEIKPLKYIVSLFIGLIGNVIFWGLTNYLFVGE